jgi:hypothetical protein
MCTRTAHARTPWPPRCVSMSAHVCLDEDFRNRARAAAAAAAAAVSRDGADCSHVSRRWHDSRPRFVARWWRCMCMLSLSRRDRHRPRREPHGDSDNDDGPQNDLASVERKRVPKGKSWGTPSPVARPLASTQAAKPNSRLQELLSRVTGEPAGTPHADDDVIFASSSATAQPLHAVTEEDTSRHAPVSTPNRPLQQRDSLPTSPTPSGDFSQVRNSQPLCSLGPVAFTRPCGSDASGAVL